MSNNKVPIQWAVEKADGTKEEIDPSRFAQKEAPLIADSAQLEAQFRNIMERKGRECGNCRYFSEPSDPELQALMVKSKALQVIENEAQIPGRYATPLMQGLCHLESWYDRRGGKLHFTPANAYCGNHAPKNRLVSFLGKLGGR